MSQGQSAESKICSSETGKPGYSLAVNPLGANCGFYCKRCFQRVCC